MSTVQRGMTKRQVKRLLGRPQKRLSQREFLRSHKSATIMGRPSGGDSWLYVNTPEEGSMTYVAFKGRRVVEVQVGAMPGQ